MTYTFKDFEKDCKTIIPDIKTPFWVDSYPSHPELKIPEGKKLENLELFNLFSVLEMQVLAKEIARNTKKISKMSTGAEMKKRLVELKEKMAQKPIWTEDVWIPAMRRIFANIGTEEDKIFMHKRLNLYKKALSKVKNN